MAGSPPTPEDLPDAVLDALREPPARSTPSADAWTRWDLAAAALLAQQPWRLRLIAVCGVDGSGKTALIEALAGRLKADGIPHRRVWSRFRNYLSKPLLALTRLTGHNRKERSQGVTHRLSRLRRLPAPGAAVPGPSGDRHGARHPGPVPPGPARADPGRPLRPRHAGRPRRRHRPGRPRPRSARSAPAAACFREPLLAVLIERSPAVIARQRPDAVADRHFARRRALYRRLAERFDLPVLTNDGPLETHLAAT